MSTTEVPKPGAINPEVTMEKLLEWVHDQLEKTMGDSDKAGEIEAVCYYDGVSDGLLWVQNLMTIDPEDKVE